MTEATRKPILCLDFDGVIHSYTSGWKGADVIPDPPVPGFFEWAREASKHFKLQIYSSRSKDPVGLKAMAWWLVEQFIAAYPHGAIKDASQHDSTVELLFPDGQAIELLIAHEKPPAFLTIDDRAWCFDGIWPDPQRLREFKTWQQKEPQAGQ